KGWLHVFWQWHGTYVVGKGDHFDPFLPLRVLLLRGSVDGAFDFFPRSWYLDQGSLCWVRQGNFSMTAWLWSGRVLSAHSGNIVHWGKICAFVTLSKMDADLTQAW
ncbi:unnamed protein product, partial [Hapterophycus canaliculatus]